MDEHTHADLGRPIRLCYFERKWNGVSPDVSHGVCHQDHLVDSACLPKVSVVPYVMNCPDGHGIRDADIDHPLIHDPTRRLSREILESGVVAKELLYHFLSAVFSVCGQRMGTDLERDFYARLEVLDSVCDELAILIFCLDDEWVEE